VERAITAAHVQQPHATSQPQVPKQILGECVGPLSELAVCVRPNAQLFSVAVLIAQVGRVGAVHQLSLQHNAR